MIAVLSKRELIKVTKEKYGTTGSKLLSVQ